jgi:hypothetical protein
MPLMAVVCCTRWSSCQAARYRSFMVRSPRRTAWQAVADFNVRLCKSLGCGIQKNASKQYSLDLCYFRIVILTLLQRTRNTPNFPRKRQRHLWNGAGLCEKSLPLRRLNIAMTKRGFYGIASRAVVTSPLSSRQRLRFILREMGDSSAQSYDQPGLLSKQFGGFYF